MVNFVEKATLLIDDKSSRNIDKINRRLATMRKNADAVSKALAKIQGPKIGTASKKLDDMAKSMSAFARAAKKVPKQVSINVKITGASASTIRSLAKALEAYKKVAGSKTTNLNVRPGQRPGSNQNAPGSRSVLLNVKPFEIMWRSAMYQLSHTITSSIAEGFAKGTKGFDIAINKARQQRLGPEIQQLYTERAFAQNRQFGGLRPDQRMDLYAELNSNFQNPLDAVKLDAQINKAVAVMMQQGQTVDEAFAGLGTFFRGLGQAGVLVGPDGGLGKDAAKFVDAFVAAKMSEGVQINWNDAYAFLKYAKTAGQTLTPDSFFLGLVAAADVGASTAGNQLNMATKTFAGETTKKAIAAQEAAGLRGPSKFVPMGKNQKGQITYTLEGGDLVDEEMFRQNATEWIQKHIISGFLAREGVDINNPTAVIKALDPLSGNRNADDFIAKTVLQLQEAMLKKRKFLDNPITPEEIKAINDASSWVKLQDATNRVTTLFGLLGDKLEGPIIAALDFFDKGIQQAIDMLLGTPADKVAGTAAFAATAGGATALSVALAKIAFATPLNTAAVSANTAAINRNTAALGAGGAGGAGRAGAAGAGAAAAGGGFFARFMRAGGAGLAAYLSMSPSLPEADQRKVTDALAKLKAEQMSPDIQANSKALSDAINKLATLQQEIAFGEKYGYSPNSDYMLDKKMAAQDAQSNIDRLQQSLANSAMELQQAFDGGATKITDATGQFGSIVQEFLGTSSTWGSQAAAAFMGALGSLNLNVNQSPAAAAATPNVGTNTNLATGG